MLGEAESETKGLCWGKKKKKGLLKTHRDHDNQLSKIFAQFSVRWSEEMYVHRSREMIKTWKRLMGEQQEFKHILKHVSQYPQSSIFW